MDKGPLVVPADVVHEQHEVAPGGRVAVLGVEPSGVRVSSGGGGGGAAAGVAVTHSLVYRPSCSASYRQILRPLYLYPIAADPRFGQSPTVRRVLFTMYFFFDYRRTQATSRRSSM